MEKTGRDAMGVVVVGEGSAINPPTHPLLVAVHIKWRWRQHSNGLAQSPRCHNSNELLCTLYIRVPDWQLKPGVGCRHSFLLGKRNKKGARKQERKKKKAAEKVPNRSGHLSLNVKMSKLGGKKGSRLGERRKSSSYTEQPPMFVAWKRQTPE